MMSTYRVGPPRDTRPSGPAPSQENGNQNLVKAGAATGTAASIAGGFLLLIATPIWASEVPDGEQYGLELASIGSLALAGLILVAVPAFAAWRARGGHPRGSLFAAAVGASTLLAAAALITGADEVTLAEAPAVEGSNGEALASGQVISSPVPVQVWFLSESARSDASLEGCSLAGVERAYAVEGTWQRPVLRFFATGEPTSDPALLKVTGRVCPSPAESTWTWGAGGGLVFIAPLS